MKRLEEIKKANAYPLEQYKLGNCCVECHEVECECFITAEEVDCLIRALEKCMEQRGFYVQEFFRLNFSREAETTDLLNQKLEQILDGK